MHSDNQSEKAPIINYAGPGGAKLQVQDCRLWYLMAVLAALVIVAIAVIILFAPPSATEHAVRSAFTWVGLPSAIILGIRRAFASKPWGVSSNAESGDSHHAKKSKVRGTRGWNLPST